MRVYVFWTLLFGTLAYALVKGGRPERLGMINLTAGSILTVLVGSPLALRFASIEADAVIVDILVLAVFLYLALSTDRVWALWTTALQLLVVLAHLAKLGDPGMIPRGYGIIMAMWSYPQIFIMAWAVRLHAKRKSDSFKRF